MKFGERKKMLEAEREDKESQVTEKSEDFSDLTSTGYSLIRHPESGFAVVVLKFNPVTMKATVKEVRKVSDNRTDAEFYFKVEVGNYFAEQESK